MGDFFDDIFQHPLNTPWTFWYLDNDIRVKYEERLFDLKSINSIEDFCTVMQAMKQITDLEVGCDYALFRDGIKPLWDEDKNLFGGQWQLKIVNSTGDWDINKFWHQMLYTMISEHFLATDDICGAVIKKRNGYYKIALWTLSGGHNECIIKLGQILKKMSTPEMENIKYYLHEDLLANIEKAEPIYTFWI